MNYEILYIIPAKYSETEIKEIDKKISAILKECGASIVKADNWGKKKLAYQIKQYRYGYYTLIIFSAEADVANKITQKLNINQDIIRFQIVKEIKQPKKRKRSKPKVEKIEKIEEETEEKEAEIKDKDKEVKKDEDKDKLKEDKEKKSEETEKDFSIDELDEKLDKLLKDTI